MNEHLGETEVVIGEKSYALRLTTNHMAHLERILDCRGELSQRLANVAGIEAMRAVFHTCLTIPGNSKRRAPREVLSIEDVGALIDAEGGLKKGAPLAIAYWELLCNCELADRAAAEKQGLLPPRPVPKAASVEEAVALPVAEESATAGST